MERYRLLPVLMEPGSLQTVSVFISRSAFPWGSMASMSLSLSSTVFLFLKIWMQPAAAMANPGMSAWAALVKRAQLQAGETVLVNGATGSAGQLAVQIARYLGAGKVIGTESAGISPTASRRERTVKR
jgi:NADPH:quinone reductase-like Zn-dependent oxidoreductase